MAWNCLVVTIFNLCDLLFAHQVTIHKSGSLGLTVFSIGAAADFMIVIIMCIAGLIGFGLDTISGAIFTGLLTIAFIALDASVAKHGNATAGGVFLPDRAGNMRIPGYV